MKKFDVPFVENPNDRCVPATIGMVLGYFMPEKEFSMAELEKITGYVQGKGTWQTQTMLSLADIGFQTHWIEDFDHKAFVEDPEGYLKTILDKEALEWQLKHSNNQLEAKRMQKYLDSNLPIEQRKGTIEDIKNFINDGWLVRLEVNENTIVGKPGYVGHSILVVGYSEKWAIIHNPDGANGNKPNQKVPWGLLARAWKEFGGSYSLYAFKKL
jgi:hypothetical protein